MKRCRWSSPVLVGPSFSSELTFSMNGAVTLAPVAGETIDSVGALLPAPEPEEAEEPPDPEEPLEAEGVLVPHAATASSAAAPVAKTNVRLDRICVLLQRDLPALVVDTSGRPAWFSALTPRLVRPRTPNRPPGGQHDADKWRDELARRPARAAAGDDGEDLHHVQPGASGRPGCATQSGERGD